MTQEPDWIIRPEHFVRYMLEANGRAADELRVPPKSILVFGNQDFRLFARLLHARIVHWNDGYAFGRVGRARISVVRTTIGAPAAVLNFEEAVALGVRQVLAFGSCGSLRTDLPLGSVVLPTHAYSEEGTSPHYGGKRWAMPNARLLRSLRAAVARHRINVRIGRTWTTDAPYRESRAKVRSLLRRGVVCVDMEASALFQVARVRRVGIASLFVVSDELAGPKWNAGFSDPRFIAAKRRAAQVVVDAIGRL
jgi:uridine phosphorylase